MADLAADTLAIAKNGPGVPAIADWLIRAGLRQSPIDELVGGVCERLVAQGVPLLRAIVSTRILHPIYGGHGFRWLRESGMVEVSRFVRGIGGSREYQHSPFAKLITENKTHLRRRLDDPGVNLKEFSVLEEVAAVGATDYVAIVATLDEDAPMSLDNCILTSWATDHPDGFKDRHLEWINTLLPPLALAVRSRATYLVAENLLGTYLGKETGRRVLMGEIDRGTTESVHAGLMYADLRHFTQTTERLCRDDLVDTLNQYLSCMAEPIEARGGEVLKFMGDGLLASVNVGACAERSMCDVLLGAAEHSQAKVAELNAARKEKGLVTMDLDIALHVGEVLYGNVGSPERLDYTVIGPAVNEVARIEGLCETLDQPILISSALAAIAKNCCTQIRPVGRHTLRGVSEPQELFALVNARA